MTQPHIIAMAKFIRDLLSYSESLIKFDRNNTQRDDLETSYIVVNGSGVSEVKSTGKSFDGDAEVLRYSESIAQSVTIEFYGNDAYTNASNFSLLSKSQSARELKKELGLSVGHIYQQTNVKQLLGSEYGNRIHLEMNVNYNRAIDVDTFRVDAVNFEYKEE